MPTRTFEAERIKTNSIYLNVVQAGPEDGPLVILLHGFPEFWFGWRRQIGYLAELGLRVWVPDQRGYNLSDKPKGVAAYQMKHLVDDVQGLIASAGAEKAMLVGHDWGAMVAWWSALRYPESIQKLGILNVPHPHVMMKTIGNDFTQMRKSWYVVFFQIPWLPEQLFTQNNASNTLSGLQNNALEGSFTDADLENYRTAWNRPHAITSMINWYRAYVRKQPEDPTSWRVKVPTMMIWGEKDGFLKKSMAQPSIDLCNEGQLHLIPSGTHWVQHDAADEVNTYLGEFLT